MKEEDLTVGEWYKITGEGFSDEDFICYLSHLRCRFQFSQSIDRGRFSGEEYSWTGIDIKDVSPMAEEDKKKYLPQYKERALGWCRTERKGQYIFVVSLQLNSVQYSDSVCENTYYIGRSNNWHLLGSSYASPLTEAEIEHFITPYLPGTKGLHVPKETFIYDEEEEGKVDNTALLDWAKLKYPAGTKVADMFDVHRFTTIKDSDIFIQAMDSSIYIDYSGYYFYLYEGGVWADRVRDESIHSDQVVSLGLAAMGGLPPDRVSNFKTEIKSFLADGNLTTWSSEERVPTMLGGKDNITIEMWRDCAKEMGLLPMDTIKDEDAVIRVPGMHNPPISLYDGLSWMLPTNKKRGSEKIEIFIKK